MRAVDLIMKKREGQELTTEEIQFLIDGFVSNEVCDYQIAALAMAIYFQGMTKREIADLTLAMMKSGDQIDLSEIIGVKVDKHSTGGVGDTTTMVLAPLVAACGAPVAKMSGRGLGHTGGTLDKLESIPGFKIELSSPEFIRNVNEIGIAVISQTGNLVPADKKLYALRDVTATVESIPLIASSIMSKKLAAGADGIVLDVKTGTGAFMKSYEDAKVLAREMVDIGNNLNRRTVAVLTDMDQPLGFAIGNALEVKEAVNTLKGAGPEDLSELCLTLGSYMLVLAGKAVNPVEGHRLLLEVIENGKALAKLKEMVQAQGGNPEVIDNLDLLPQAEQVVELMAWNSGYIQKINALKIGESAMLLGAGRVTKSSKIDLAVGVVLNKKIGDRVTSGEKLAELHVNDSTNLNDAMNLMHEAFVIGIEKPEQRPLVFEIVQ